MSDADRATLIYDDETVFGVADSGNPVFKALRFTGESLNQTTQTVLSTEIRADRQVVDVIRTSINGAGDINFEMSYGAYDDFMAAALLSSLTWSSAVVNADTDIGATVTTNVIDRAAGSWVTDGFVVGQWVKVSGFTNAANNGHFKILAVAALDLTVDHDLATEAAGASVTVDMGSQIVNGTTLASFSLEREYTDLTNEFALFLGMSIDTFNLSIAADQIITGSFGFVGKSEVSASSTSGDGTPTASPTNDIMNGIDDITHVLEGKAVFPATSFGFSLSNNLRSRLQIASLGPISLGTGKVQVQGTIQGYFTSPATMDKYLNQTASAFTLVIEEGARSYIIEFPQLKFVSGQRVAGGENQDIIADLAFAAYRDAAESVTIRIARWSS